MLSPPLPPATSPPLPHAFDPPHHPCPPWQADAAFLPALFDQLKRTKPGEQRWNDLVAFLQVGEGGHFWGGGGAVGGWRGLQAGK